MSEPRYGWHEEGDPERPVKLRLPLNEAFDDLFRWFPDMRYSAKLWCAESLKREPEFSKGYDNGECYYGHFATEEDAIFFKMHFF